MKRIILLVVFLCSFLMTINAQISEVKTDNGAARIYHEGENYPSYSLTIDRGCYLGGYNTKYVVIACEESVRIYKDKEYNASYTFHIDRDCFVKNVTASAIIVKYPGQSRYFDFQGKYVKSTND
jgi:hypothetical protein